MKGNRLDVRVSQNWGYLFGGPHNRDSSILGSPNFLKTTMYGFLSRMELVSGSFKKEVSTFKVEWV